MLSIGKFIHLNKRQKEGINYLFIIKKLNYIEKEWIEKENRNLKLVVEQLKSKIKILENENKKILEKQNILLQDYKNLIERILWFHLLENEKIDKILNNKNLTNLHETDEIRNQYKIIKCKELEQPFQLTNVDFIQDPKLNLEDISCLICLNVITPPFAQCRNCEDLFCEKCIDEHILKKNDCPKCRDKPFMNQKLGRSLKYLLNLYTFICPMNCGKTFGLSDSDNHKNSCELIRDVYKCSLCNAKYFEYQNDLKEFHQDKCEKLKKTCIYCAKNINVYDHENHLIPCLKAIRIETTFKSITEKYAFEQI